MAAAAFLPPRVTVDGKFFRLGADKFFVKGLSYGPFAPDAAGRTFASREQTEADFQQIQSAHANLVRVYHVPEPWFLDLAQQHGLKVLLDIPWNKHLCFLDSLALRQQAIDAVRSAVYACARHPAVFGFSVANEIPPDVVRWSRAERITAFLDLLIAEAKAIDPEALCTFSNFPPTEFLRPAGVDFSCFNVYLHQASALRAYLARLQMQAEARPLILGEFGMDSLREGEERKCEYLKTQVEQAFRAGLAGVVTFNYTDDWWRGGAPVTDWKMGVTTRDRQPKPSFAALTQAYATAPFFPPLRTPKVSVVVATYNGARTLDACLESLRGLNYPDLEIIVVDDGSTDNTDEIIRKYPDFHSFRHEKNLGLSVARNTGISAATGEIVAFTDSDCRADSEWLRYLISDLATSEFAGMGGPNLLPPEDSPIAAAVMASPGGPAHVMLTDRQAEHIPGCNMAFYKWALEEIGGFDPIFHAAGDDVDVCWRVQQAGHKIGFSPAAFVWHYRRSTVRDYLKQQHGYGEAEALLVRKHPEYFNLLGGSIWRGRIYTQYLRGIQFRRPIIYRGLFGSAGFASLYANQPDSLLFFVCTLEYHILIALPLWVLSAVFQQFLPLAITSLLIPVIFCVGAGIQAQLPPGKVRWWTRPLVGLLFFLQPIVRGWARYQGRLSLHPAPLSRRQSLDSAALEYNEQSLRQLEYWANRRIDRLAFVADVLRRLDQQGWPNKVDTGWNDFDAEILGGRWTNVQFATVAEELEDSKQVVRCRLTARWSLRARALFWSLCAGAAVLLGLTAASHPLAWLVLLFLPAFAWFMQTQHRKLQSVLVVLLDEVAKDWKLTKILPTQPASQQPPTPQFQPAPNPAEPSPL
jgi:GT2 family glycosyltransferase